MGLARNAFIVGGFTLISRILGYIRDIFIALMLGAGPLADAFLVAFRLPNFFRQISAEGAFNNAFIPLYSGTLAQEGEAKAKLFASHVISFMLPVLVCFVAALEIAMPWVMALLAPGFLDNPEQFSLTVLLGRITMPYLAFISLVALLSGMLQSHNRFAAAAAAPILLNLCLITALFTLSHFTPTHAHALAWGVAVAGVVQLIWVVVHAIRLGLFPSLARLRLTGDVKLLLKRMLPGVIGGGVTQLNVLINTILATLLPSAVSYLYYADRLVQFPLAIIGTAMGTALLPSLSKYIKNKQHAKAIEQQNLALMQVMLFTIPGAIGLILLSEPLIRLMFERGAFEAEATYETAAALLAYACGLPAFILIKIFLPGFFAKGDTKTPVIIAAICLFINLATSLSLMWSIGHIALAVATAFSSWCNAALLVTILYRRRLYHTTSIFWIQLLKMLLASAIMAVSLYYYMEWSMLRDIRAFFPLLQHVVIALLISVAVYFSICWILKIHKKII